MDQATIATAVRASALAAVTTCSTSMRSSTIGQVGMKPGPYSTQAMPTPLKWHVSAVAPMRWPAPTTGIVPVTRSCALINSATTGASAGVASRAGMLGCCALTGMISSYLNLDASPTQLGTTQADDHWMNSPRLRTAYSPLFAWEDCTFVNQFVTRSGVGHPDDFFLEGACAGTA